MADDSREETGESGEIRAPADLPASPSLSYNPRMATGFGPEEQTGEPNAGPSALTASSAPTFRLHPEEPQQWIESPVPSHSEAEQAEALGFTLTRVIGRGAMGEVWEAIQRRLWRLVAVKRLRRRRDGAGPDANAVMRLFQGDAMTAALLDHPNIVPVHDLAFDESGAPLLAMKLARGVGWNRLLDADFRALAPEEHLGRHLPILTAVCQAVAFAHSRGIVHRDLKPSQVMVGEFGEVLLMDWGLAILVGDPPQMPGEVTPDHVYPTREAADNPAGTPGYMAPEQTEDTPANLGPWTDVYLLGGMLYCVLTGRLPHPGSSSQSAFKNAARGFVEPFERAAPGRPVPEELALLAMSAMAPETQARPTAKEFLAVLQDYSTGATRRRESAAIAQALKSEGQEQTYAGYAQALARIGQAQRLWPGNPELGPVQQRVVEGYAKLALKTGDLALAEAQAELLGDAGVRDPILAGVRAERARIAAQQRRLRQFAGAILLLLATIIGGGILFTLNLQIANSETSKQLVVARFAQKTATAAKATAQQESERATLLLADSLVGQGRRAEAVEELQRIPEGKRTWEWAYVLTRAIDYLWMSPFEYLAASPSGEFAIGVQRDQGLCALRMETGEVLGKIADGAPGQLCVAFARDESRAAISAAGMAPRLYETAGWTLLRQFDGATTATVSAMEFSPDGRQLAIGDDSGAAVIVADSGEVVRRLLPHRRPLRGLYWGKKKLVALSSDTAWRHDLAGGPSELVHRSESGEHPSFRWFIPACDAKRERFAFCFFRTPIQHGLVDGGPLETIRTSGEGIVFCSKRPWMIYNTGRHHPQVGIYDFAKGEEVRRFEGVLDEWRPPGYMGMGPRPAYGIQLSPDESLLAVATDGGFRFVSVPEGASLTPDVPITGDGLARIFFAPRGGAVWAAEVGKGTFLRPIAAGYVGVNTPGNTASFGADDTYTSTIRENWFEQRDTATGRLIFAGGRYYNWYLGGSVSKDGKTIMLPGRRGSTITVEVGDRETGTIRSTFEWPGMAVGMMDVDAERLALAVVNDTLSTMTLYSLAGKQAVKTGEAHPPAGDAFVASTYTPDGSRIIAATDKGELRLLEAATGRLLAAKEGHAGGLATFGFAKGGSVLSTSGADNRLRFWKPETLTQEAEYAFDFLPRGVAVSGDGKRIAAWPARGTPEIRDAATGKLLARLARTDFPMGSARFIAGGTRIAAWHDGAARFWDTESGIETFNIDSDFGGISNNERAFVMKSGVFAGTLLDLAPYKVPEEAAGASFKEFLDEWLVERYAKWATRREAARLPEMIDLVEGLSGEVGGDQSGIALGAMHSVVDFAVPGTEPAKRKVFECGARILMARAELAGTHPDVWTRQLLRWALMLFPESAAGPMGAACIYGGAGAAAEFESRGTRNDDPANLSHVSDWLQAMSRALELRGDRERALQVARRNWAMRSLGGFLPGPEEELIRRLGGTIPEPAPEALRRGASAALPNRFLRDYSNVTPDAKRRDIERMEEAARAALLAEWDAYLAKTPPLDWQAVMAEAKALPEWNPYPAGTTFRDVANEMRAVYEQCLFGDAGLEGAQRAERERIEKAFAFKKRVGQAAPSSPSP